MPSSASGRNEPVHGQSFGGYGHEIIMLIADVCLAVCVLAIPDLTAIALEPHTSSSGKVQTFGILLLGVLSILTAARSLILLIVKETRRIFRCRLDVVNRFSVLPSISFILQCSLLLIAFVGIAPLAGIVSLHPTIADVVRTTGANMAVQAVVCREFCAKYYNVYLEKAHPSLSANLYTPLKTIFMKLSLFVINSIRVYVVEIYTQLTDPRFRHAASGFLYGLGTTINSLVPAYLRNSRLTVYGSKLVWLPLVRLFVWISANFPSVKFISDTAYQYWWKVYGIIPDKPMAVIVVGSAWRLMDQLQSIVMFTVTGEFLNSPIFADIETQFSIIYLIVAALLGWFIMFLFMPTVYFDHVQKRAYLLQLCTVVTAVQATIVAIAYFFGDILVILSRYVFDSTLYTSAMNLLAIKPTAGFETEIALKMRTAPPDAFRYLGTLAVLSAFLFGLLRSCRASVAPNAER